MLARHCDRSGVNDGLGHPVPRDHRDAAHNRCGSPASRCSDRLLRGASHLGTKPLPSPLRRSGWRAIAGRKPVDRMPSPLLPSGGCALAAVSSAVPGRPAESLHSRQAFFSSLAGLSDAAIRIWCATSTGWSSPRPLCRRRAGAMLDATRTV